ATAAAQPEMLRDLGKVFADDHEPHDRRLEAAGQLGQALRAFGAQPSRPDATKLPVILALIRQCRPVYEQGAEPEVRLAAARVLGILHRQAHALYKPDESAQDRAVRLYRAKHPAANHAAEAIVIYQTATD